MLNLPRLSHIERVIRQLCKLRHWTIVPEVQDCRFHHYVVVSCAIKQNKCCSKINVLLYFIAAFVLLQLWFHVQ